MSYVKGKCKCCKKVKKVISHSKLCGHCDGLIRYGRLCRSCKKVMVMGTYCGRCRSNKSGPRVTVWRRVRHRKLNESGISG